MSVPSSSTNYTTRTLHTSRNNQGLVSIQRPFFMYGISIINIKRPWNRLISIMIIPIPVRQNLYIELGQQATRQDQTMSLVDNHQPIKIYILQHRKYIYHLLHDITIHVRLLVTSNAYSSVITLNVYVFTKWLYTTVYYWQLLLKSAPSQPGI